jgi:C4-dicarboxylate transporter, DctQ subunit
MTRLSRLLARAEDFVLAAGIGLATLFIAVQVVLRYGFNRGFPWAEELSVYAVIWSTFVAASAALRDGSHLSVDIIELVLRGRTLRFVNRIAFLIVAAFGAALVVLGGELVRRAAEFGQLSAALQAPMWIVYLILPISGALMVVRAVPKALFPASDDRTGKKGRPA